MKVSYSPGPTYDRLCFYSCFTFEKLKFLGLPMKLVGPALEPSFLGFLLKAGGYTLIYT